MTWGVFSYLLGYTVTTEPTTSITRNDKDCGCSVILQTNFLAYFWHFWDNGPDRPDHGWTQPMSISITDDLRPVMATNSSEETATCYHCTKASERHAMNRVYCGKFLSSVSLKCEVARRTRSQARIKQSLPVTQYGHQWFVA